MTIRAKDIMTKQVVTVGRHTSVETAIQLMLENEIAGIPVVEEDRTLVGIVTEKDLLSLFYGPQDAAEKTVQDFMTQPAVHFDEDESLADICRLLLEVTFRRVPVTSKDRVVGIVSRPDVIRCILQQMSQKENV
ncbi:MAG: CBS domain-containing protein [Planctomycetota bacterium]|jgi:CBS domain-containing protein